MEVSMILIEAFKGKPVTEQSVEIVERKGKGHPDYICDAVMDAVSVALCKHYMSEFGAILHHNIDKGLLVAGRTEKRFGGGRVVYPMELVIGDRATSWVQGRKLPVKELALATAKRWFQENLRFVNPERDVKYRCALHEGSEELKDIFSRQGEVRGANDTSAALGYYPLSPTEQVVLEVERHLNSKEFKERFPETGEDVKVMGLRKAKGLDITVAMPLLCRSVSSEEEYFVRKGLIQEEIQAFLDRYRDLGFRDVALHYNTLDEAGRGLGGVYLSLLGSSAEDADSGQVGRGNRVNGLISMNRPMGTEAAAGKNPVSHVGKIYNVLAHKMAKEICRNSDGVKEVHVLLMSRIGSPIDKPMMASAQVLLEKGKRLKDISHSIKGILEEGFHHINSLCLELAEGKHPIC
jgi:S-adenosylmethionine synthetase